MPLLHSELLGLGVCLPDYVEEPSGAKVELERELGNGVVKPEWRERSALLRQHGECSGGAGLPTEADQ